MKRNFTALALSALLAAGSANSIAAQSPATTRAAITSPAITEPDALIATGLRTPVRVGPTADARIKWWRDARFGMFIHFGVYAIPGKGEWVM